MKRKAAQIIASHADLRLYVNSQNRGGEDEVVLRMGTTQACESILRFNNTTADCFQSGSSISAQLDYELKL